MSGARPDTYRCNKAAADDKWLSASLIIWTQFYAPRFSPSNRHHFLSAVGTAEIKEIRPEKRERNACSRPLHGKNSYVKAPVVLRQNARFSQNACPRETCVRALAQSFVRRSRIARGRKPYRS